MGKKKSYDLSEASKPKIWRRLLIPADMLLRDLHKVIQTAMGWANSYLHQFAKGKVILEPPVEEDFLESAGIDYTFKKSIVTESLVAVPVLGTLKKDLNSPDNT